MGWVAGNAYPLFLADLTNSIEGIELVDALLRCGVTVTEINNSDFKARDLVPDLGRLLGALLIYYLVRSYFQMEAIMEISLPSNIFLQLHACMRLESAATRL